MCLLAAVIFTIYSVIDADLICKTNAAIAASLFYVPFEL